MISIIICTRDRATQLQACLAQLRRASEDSPFSWQLVIVDNGSSDDTRSVVERFTAQLPVTYAYEARRGLSHARNRGIVEARHALLAFTDDDCLASPGWLQAIVTQFAAQPELSILGGRVELADPADAPMSIRTHDHTEMITTPGQILALLAGCNMAFRREVFERTGMFDPAFGKGRAIGSAEDLDMLYRALKQGTGMAYVPHIVVRHAHGRRAPDALARLAREYVRGRGAFYAKHIRDGSIARMAYWDARAMLRPALQPGAIAAPGALSALAAGAALQCIHKLRAFGARAAGRPIA